LSWQPIKVPLQAGYDPALLAEMLETIASFLDDPAQLPQILSETAMFEEGRSGYVTDIEASCRWWKTRSTAPPSELPI
jgi:hypothetical protein